MREKIAKNIILLIVISLFCAGQVTATINTISQGNVVFIGEEGLDISSAMGTATQAGWWAPAADVSSSPPTKTIDLKTRITNFIATPSEFSVYQGNWYRLTSAGKADDIAFSVVDPYLDLKIEDATVNVDVETLRWIPAGDDIRFRIETNLVQMASQRSAPPLITLHVQSPDGGSYTSLYNAGGTPVSIVEIPVTTSPYYTDPVWNMGNRDRYPEGTYTIWAECNVNKMHDNYGQTGKTMSRKFNLLNQGTNPLIRTSTPSTQVPTYNTPAVPTQTTVTTQLPTIVTTMTVIPISTTIPSPTPIQTKAPGFGATLTGAAILFGLVFILKKE